MNKAAHAAVAPNNNNVVSMQQVKDLLCRKLKPLEEDITRIKGDIQQVKEDMYQMNEDMKSDNKVYQEGVCKSIAELGGSMRAMFHNVEARRKNRIIHDDLDNHQNFVVLRKVNPDTRMDLEVTLSEEMLNKAIVNNAFPHPFPKTRMDLATLSRDQIMFLAAWSNDEMGIMPDDNEDTCRDKFADYILGTAP